MLESMTEHAFNIILKSTVLLTAWIGFAIEQVGGNVEHVVNQAFELSFSLGVLVLIVIYFIYENRMKDSKKDQVQESLVILLEKNISAINGFTQSNRDMTKTMERLQETNVAAMNNLAAAFEKMEDRLK